MVVIGVAAAMVILWITARWWADGLISGTEMIVLTVIFGGLVVGVFAASGVCAQLLVLSLLLGSTGWMVHQHMKDSARRYYRDKIRIYQQAIQADPGNTAARSAMAAAYYALGDLDSAVAALELAVQMSQQSFKESYQLEQWQQERELRDSRTIVCRFCYTKNLWGEARCRTCRQPLVYPQGVSWFRSVVSSLGPSKTIVGVGWILLTCLSFVFLPVAQAGIVVLCGACAGAGWMLLASKRN